MEQPRKEVQNTTQGTPNIEEANTPREDGILWLKIATAVVCIVNMAYSVATAVLIGKLKGWYYSIHCFILCLLILCQFIRTAKAKTKIKIKGVCWEICSGLVLVLMTTFTLLTRQAYYHPSPHLESKWILFFLQASIIPLLGGILVMYECSIRGLYQDRFILLIAVLDFADIWDMVSILSQHSAPFIKEESPLEIAVQFFCSFSLSIFSVLIYKNIAQEGLNSMFKNDDQPTPELNKVEAQNTVTLFCSKYAASNSQLYQNLPFLVIRILLLVNHGFLDFDYLAKNGISVMLFFLGCCCCRGEDNSDQ